MSAAARPDPQLLPSLRSTRLELVRGLVGEEERKHFGHCAYCGRWCYGPACSSHLDLVYLERAAVR